MKNYFPIIVAVILFLSILGSCGDSSSSNSSSRYSGYSSTYKNDAGYRDDVKEIADAYGVSEKEVDQKINAITGGR